MNNIIFTPETAPEKSQPLLNAAQEKLGMIPNVFGGMAVAPATLQAYLGLSAAFSQTSLSPTEQHVVAISISNANGCGYCIAAHTTMAQSQGVCQDNLDAARNNTALEPKLEALRTFALRMQESKGHLEEGELKAFLSAGYTEAQAYEVIVGIALKVIANYSNRLLNTPLDEAFAANSWEKPACETSCGCN